MEEKHIPWCPSPLDEYRGRGKAKPLATEKKKPGRKKKPVKPITVTHSETPIVLEFK
jgi:hypothetical protein